LADDLRDVNAKKMLREDTKVLSQLSDFLQIPNTFYYKQYIRKVINRPYSEVIENYEEVVAAVKDSDLAQFADSI
jgi:hypothetical protein